MKLRIPVERIVASSGPEDACERGVSMGVCRPNSNGGEPKPSDGEYGGITGGRSDDASGESMSNPDGCCTYGYAEAEGDEGAA